MEDVKEEVVSSATEEEVVETPEVDQQETEEVQEPIEEEVNIAPALEAGQPSDDVDSMGVPYKNRYHEQKRKFDDLSTKVETLTQKLESNSQQKEYSMAELKVFRDNNPEHAAWADTEIEKLQEKKQKAIVEDTLRDYQRKQQAEQLKRDTFASTINRYPEIALKDTAGNFLGWNTKSPLFQRINVYMSDPEVANNPRGLSVASALAYQDVNLNNSNKTKKVITKQKSAIKSLQKHTMVEGGGKVAQTSNVNDSRERLRRSGSFKDAADAIGDIFVKQGVIK